MSTIQSHKNLNNTEWGDNMPNKVGKSVLIIGGGLGGISAAISLAQGGYKVALYEQNAHLGGKLNQLALGGFLFDLGPSILTMPHLFEKLFTASGRSMSDYIKITRLDHEWRSFFTDGTIIDLYGDLETMSRQNPNLTSQDIADYKSLLDYAQRLYTLTDKGYFAKGLDNTLAVVKYHGVVESILGFDYFSSMYDGIAKRVRNQNLRDMLAYFIKYVGSSPYDAPAILNMMIYMQHKLGVWYVPGGMHGIADGLQKLAEEIGVEFHTGQAVRHILHDGQHHITAIELADGTRLSADCYVSNREVIPTYQDLLNEEPSFIRQFERFEPACSGLVLHIGVDRLYPQLAHHNFFFSADPRSHFNKVFHRYELPDDPTIYVVNVNKTDPAQAPAGHENIKILPHIPYIQDPPFTSDDYRQLREIVLVKLERMGLTDLRQHIVVEDMWTPEDIRRMYGSDRGAIYGVVADRKRNHGFKHPKQSSRYHNLYFVGGSVNPGGGMPMVTLCGQRVSDMIVQRDLRG